ncbi:glucuronosyltransferase [Rhizobium sp. CG5]|uniref:UDP-N-acetylglucosamine transferase subunit ALG14 n=1 Tax=Rhizobium sp. CG5 TaxID=2726076 RepID=UPI0020348E0A|nr:UDP-N-acetylglucosamine transferase subunit ALG14 [Rhizobium sp. CG5]MCM2476295.1 glucuronosyltransferase [Rhizobium sp. CG5]
MTDKDPILRVLAVSSGGGHWEQLMLVVASFEGAHVAFANTIDGLAEKSGVSPAYLVADCNRDKIFATVQCALGIFRIIHQEKPDVIISTGAAPGILALAIGKVFGARTIWLDSVANSERLSLSGKFAGKIADLWLTQWRHLATDNGPKYYGSVL